MINLPLTLTDANVFTVYKFKFPYIPGPDTLLYFKLLNI